MKKSFILMAVFILLGSNLYAGNLTVNGDITANNIWMKVTEVDLTNSPGHTVTGLDGDKQKMYKVIFNGTISSSPGNSRMLLLRANGDNTNYRGFYKYNGSIGGDDSIYIGMFLGQAFWTSSAGTFTIEYTMGAETGKLRCGSASPSIFMTETYNLVDTGTNVSCWKNTTDNITSLRIEPTNGTISGRLMVFALQ